VDEYLRSVFLMVLLQVTLLEKAPMKEEHVEKSIRKAPFKTKLPIIILMGTGLFISGYLFYTHHISGNTNTGGQIDFCYTAFGKGCNEALNSPLSNLFGLSLAGWGIMYFLTLYLLLILPRLIDNEFAVISLLCISIFTLIGALTSLGLLIIMIINPSLFCPLCTAIHIINLILFILIVKASSHSSVNIFKKHTYLNFLGLKIRNSFILISKVFAFLLFIFLFGVAIYLGLNIAEGTGNLVNKPSAFNKQLFLERFASLPRNEIPVYKDDAILGPSKAPIQLIVFSDFQCPACKYFSQVLTKLNEQYEGKIQVVFKHFPLGTACNNSIGEDVHPRACEIALASEAARQQGKFWEFHDAIFKSDMAAGKETVCSIAMRLGLNHQLFEKVRIGETAKHKVSQTVHLASQLGIDYTPAVYLNGRLVNDIRFGPVQLLIENTLDQQSKSSVNKR
jgi:protein-disulfide isomerase/uncharacterized membrane protein